ncbi:hypothetical protein C8R43DRAFT_1004992 [Mycena crocata]|nr:hypothetical protein C8R43DRAFT_1004992 [Mycena crocata]
MRSRALAFAALGLISPALSQTWCNKHYLQGQPEVPPGGHFPIPEQSTTPLLVLRCAPIITPYLEVEDNEAGILVETFVTFARYNGAEALSAPLSEVLEVSISVNGSILAAGVVPFNGTAELHFPLANLSSQPRKQPFIIDCTASTASQLSPEAQIFSATTTLSYLPRPLAGSVTKRDSRTGALLVKPLSEALFPFGFYTSFDNYLDTDLRLLDDLKAQGFTTVHPVPTFGDLKALGKVLDRMEELGLYLVYDMRHTYNNLTALAAEVDMIKHRRNLLLWYTADEPDGTSEPLNATRLTYDAIYALDGYHPVSIALNCADYEFAAYTAGADVVMPDTYTIANDPAFSAKYNTSCTADFGCCGCDDCHGELEDISRRLDDFAMRLDVLGRARTTAVWTVPQAFGGEEFWTRPPTGREFAVQVILSLNHGARGIMPWIDPTPPDIKRAASELAIALNSTKAFFFNPRASFTHILSRRVDVGLWTQEAQTLVLVVNLDTHDAAVELPLSNALELREVLSYGVGQRFGVSRSSIELDLEGLGCAIFVASPLKPILVVQGDEL